jgi:hypothetical protein
MAGKGVWGVAGVVAGALSVIAANSFSGGMTEVSFSNIAANAVGIRENFHNNCSRFQTDFNKALDKAGVPEHIATRIELGRVNEPYGECSVFVESNTDQNSSGFVGAFDHRGYEDPNGVYGQNGMYALPILGRRLFLRDVLNGFTPEDQKKISKADIDVWAP